MARKTNRETIGVLIDSKPINRDRQYGTIRLNLVRVDGEKITNPDWESPFCDLQFNAQWDASDPEKPVYGWDIEYRQPYGVSLPRARKMYKTLRTIERAREKFPVTPLTFGQYVSLISKALGIKYIVRETEGLRDGNYSSGKHQILKIDYVQGFVDDLIGKTRRPEEKKVEEEVPF